MLYDGNNLIYSFKLGSVCHKDEKRKKKKKADKPSQLLPIFLPPEEKSHLYLRAVPGQHEKTSLKKGIAKSCVFVLCRKKNREDIGC